MDMFMHRLVRQGVWLGILALVAVTVVGCNSTTTKTETATVTGDTSLDDQPTKGEVAATSSPACEKETQASVSGDPHASRANPFSEDSVQALEGMLRPLEAIPAETQATVSRDG